MKIRKYTKSIVSIILCLVMLISLIPLTLITTYAYSTGDLNNDKKVNAIDAIILTQQILGIETSNLSTQVSDINHDDKVNSIDMSLLEMNILGKYEISNTKYKIGEVIIGGKDISDYTIILPTEYPSGSYIENAEYAGELLTKYIKEACGIKVNISKYSIGSCIKFVYDEELGKEAFNINVLKGQVEIKCGLARGAMYAAFGMLSDIFGFTFYPKDVIVIEEQDTIEIESGYTHTEGLNTNFEFRAAHVTSRVREVVPDCRALIYKMSTVANHFTSCWDWGYWLNDPKYGYSSGPDRNHSINRYLPGKALTESGKYCFTNSDNVSLCIEKVSEYIDSLIDSGYVIGENMPKISITMADTDEWCVCRNCLKLKRLYGTNSSTLVDFLNKVSDALTPNYQGIELWTLAYAATNIAPTGMETRSNITYCFAPINHCMNHALFDENCSYNSRDFFGNTSYIEGWKELTDNLYIWWYGVMYLMSAYYIPQINWLYDSLVKISEYGFKGVFLENEDSTLGFTDMTSYLASEIMWNPDITKDEYLDMVKKYCKEYYGTEQLYDLLMILEECRSDGCFYCFYTNSETNRKNWPAYDSMLISQKFDRIYELYDNCLIEITNDETLERFKRAITSVQFSVLSESHTELYVNGTSTQRITYVQRYKNMYNYLEEIEGKYVFSVIDYAGTPVLPIEFDPSIKPRDWYK